MRHRAVPVGGPRPARLAAGLLGLALGGLAATGCSRDARPPAWLPGETLPARQAIDAQWNVADQYVGQAVRDRKIVGAEVAIVTPDGWSTRGFGWATGSAQPTERTLYEIGSISKVFTGTLLADMAVRRQVSLVATAQSLLPGRLRMPPSTRPITLMDLATHMSGMPRLPPNMHAKNKSDPYADFTVDDLWASLGKTRLEREPGVAKDYSNYGMGLLGQLLVLRADKDDYEALVRERILGPLGMNDTTVALSEGQAARFAWGHDKNNVRTSPWNIPTLAGAGGIRSTGRDMAIFAQAFLRADSPIAAAAQEALVPRGIPGEGPWDQGLGWVVKRDRSYAWHNGGTGGFHTWMGIDFTHRVAVVVLCNTSIDDVDGWGSKILSGVRGALSNRGVASLDGASPDDVTFAADALAPGDDQLEVAFR